MSKSFTLPTSWQPESYPGHWSFAYEPNAARREDYDFRVTFGQGVPESEQRAVIALLEAAPKLLVALVAAERFISGFEDDETQSGINELLSSVRNAVADATGKLEPYPERADALLMATAYIDYVKAFAPELHRDADGTPSIEATIRSVIAGRSA